MSVGDLYEGLKTRCERKAVRKNFDVLLGIILLGTVGCSHTVSDTPSIDAEIAEFLQVSASQAGVSVGRNPDNRPALTGREDHGSRPAGVRE